MLDDMIRRKSPTGIRHSRTASHGHPDVPLRGLPWCLHISSRPYRNSCRATRDHRTCPTHYPRPAYNVREARMESL